MATPPPRRGKNTITRTAWLALSLLLLVLALSITPVHSRQLGFTSTTSGQKGSEFRAWRKEDVMRPDRTTDLAPPAPKPNSDVPGGPPLG